MHPKPAAAVHDVIVEDAQPGEADILRIEIFAEGKCQCVESQPKSP
jgi:hypothetical protein